MIARFVGVLFIFFGGLFIYAYADTPMAPSAASIKAEQEKMYGKKIKVLKMKDPLKDAMDAAALGFPYVLGHYEGRSQILVLPGVDLTIYANNKERVPVLHMDGLGDSIYGKNHAEYRQLMDQYARKFNSITFKACLKK